MCLSVGELSDVRVRPGGLWISAVEPVFIRDGAQSFRRNVLRMWRVEDNFAVDLIVDMEPASGHGMSGGVHDWNASGDAVVVVTREHGLAVVWLDAADQPTVVELPVDPSRSWSTPCWSHDDSQIAASVDSSAIGVIDVRSGVYSEQEVSGAFAFDIAWRGSHPVCHTWDKPHMPWTQSRITGVFEGVNVAVQQPRASLDGRSFGYISDEGGMANVVIEADHMVGERVVIADSCEHGGAVWGPGQRTWCFNDDASMVAYTRNEGGFGSLYVYDRRTGQRTMVGRAAHDCVSWSGNMLAAIRSGAKTPQQIVLYNMVSPHSPQRIRTMSVHTHEWAPYEDHLVEPTLHVAADGASSAHYRLFVPAEPNGALIAFVHGGPVDQWQVTFRPRLNYWVSRGFAVAVVDTRGSAGFGRQFTHALHGHWGEFDSQDLATALRDLYAHHGFTPAQTVLMGGSSGGLTVLAALRDHEGIAAGGVVNYPVVDFGLLLQGDDPFEGHYTPTLVGTNDIDSRIVQERSINLQPGHLATTSLLIFHGDQDKVVPLEHSQRLVRAVSEVGGKVDFLVLSGEGHGFRNTENVLVEYDTSERFVRTLLRV